jgi:transcriptional regulator with XRE-family HTH domain
MASSDEAADAGQAIDRFGGRLRAQRTARNLTIAQVAEAAGLTKGFVSRLERDQSSVSIAALLRICDVLHTPIGSLFESPSSALVRASEAPIVEFNKGQRRLLYTPADFQDLQVVRIQLDPGVSAGREEWALHGGTEFIQVLTGGLEFWLEAEKYLLDAGDSLTFRGNVPHTYRNSSRQTPCEALIVIAPAP